MERRKKLAVLVVLALVAIPCAVALAKKTPPPPVDLSQTTWTGTGTVTVNIAKVGKKTINDQQTLFFGTNAYEYLGPNQFLLISNLTSLTYRGTWSDPKQTGAATFVMNPAMLDANVSALCAKIADYEHVKYTNVQATATKPKITGALVPGKTGTMTLSINFTCIITMEGGVKQKYTGTFSGTSKLTQAH